jgi:hypothetical protein
VHYHEKIISGSISTCTREARLPVLKCDSLCSLLFAFRLVVTVQEQLPPVLLPLRQTMMQLHFWDLLWMERCGHVWITMALDHWNKACWYMIRNQSEAMWIVVCIWKIKTNSNNYVIFRGVGGW